MLQASASLAGPFLQDLASPASQLDSSAEQLPAAPGRVKFQAPAPGGSIAAIRTSVMHARKASLRGILKRTVGLEEAPATPGQHPGR